MTTAETTANLREEVRDLNRTISDLVNLVDLEMNDLEFTDLVGIGDVLGHAGDLLAMISKQIKQTANERMKKAKVKNALFVGLDGESYTVEQANTPSRTGVRKDELLRDVERMATDPQRRVDPKTGEVRPIEEALLEILKTAFRFEPRWSEITKLGLNDDEYCSKSWTSTVKIARVETL